VPKSGTVAVLGKWEVTPMALLMTATSIANDCLMMSSIIFPCIHVKIGLRSVNEVTTCTCL